MWSVRWNKGLRIYRGHERRPKKGGGKSKLVLGASLVDVDVSSLEGSGELAARTLHNDVASVDLDLH